MTTHRLLASISRGPFVAGHSIGASPRCMMVPWIATNEAAPSLRFLKGTTNLSPGICGDRYSSIWEPAPARCACVRGTHPSKTATNRAASFVRRKGGRAPFKILCFRCYKQRGFAILNSQAITTSMSGA